MITGCYSVLEDTKCIANDANSTFYNGACTSVEKLCKDSNYDFVNRTFCSDNNKLIHISEITNRTLATHEYFNKYVLGVTDDITWENYGGIRWELVGCLLLAWIICYLCVVRGVKSSGKAVYFTALFPYVVLTALVIQGATLEGAIDGIKLYITPQWDRLLDAEVWGNAASQTFYSFGIACGSLITLSSYSDFSNNCLKDALIVSAANAFTSVYAGFAIFSMLGFLANQMNVPVENVATDGPGLAFVAYPEAILLLPVAPLWAFIFFFMLFILGLGSQFAGVEAISTTILDKWPHLRQHHWKVTLGICLCCFILALPMCFDGGVFLFTLMEWNTASWAILLIGLAEVVIASWAYGCNKFIDHMVQMKMNISKIERGYWWACWVVITPLTLIVNTEIH